MPYVIPTIATQTMKQFKIQQTNLSKEVEFIISLFVWIQKLLGCIYLTVTTKFCL